MNGHNDMTAPTPLHQSGWPPLCTLAELARILTLVHGVRAPTESSIKKWSAAGAFRSCLASEDEIQAAEAPSSLSQNLLQRPRRAGRPGLKLRTAQAIGRVYELWPFLGESDPHAVMELVVARTADHLRLAIAQAAPSGSHPPEKAIDAAAAEADHLAPALKEVERQVALLTHEIAALKREVGQFAALRNNLITRLDDAVVRAKETLERGGPGGGSIDPLVEARRDRDMGVMKSTLAEILNALQRIETDVARKAIPGAS